jgi:hypothetical protein
MLVLTLAGSAALQLAGAATSADSPFIRDKRAYDACITSKALLFEKAKESVENTVNAAFAACKNERATLYFTMEDTRKKSGQEFDREWAERFITTLVDNPRRDETTVLLMEIRSGVR